MIESISRGAFAHFARAAKEAPAVSCSVFWRPEFMLSLPLKYRRILSLALPIIGGMLSQNVLNLVDTLMVGQLGYEALAAVGAAGFVQFTCTAFITGLATGVQAIAARRLGEGRSSESAVPLNGGLVLSFLLGLPLTVGLFCFFPQIFGLVSQDPAVQQIAAPYLQMRSLSVIFVAVNFSFRGFFNGIERSSVYFRTLVIMHTINVVLNWLLIFGHAGFPAMGATGAALASSIAFAMGSALYFLQAWNSARSFGFMSRFPGRHELANILRLSVPTGLQQTFFALGMTVFFTLLGTVGTREVAASSVLVNLLLVVILPSIGFGLAAATLVSRSLGAGEKQEARQWGNDVMRVALIVMCALGALGAAFPSFLLGPFLHDPETLQLAKTPLRMIALSLPFDALGLVIMQALLGAGDNKRVMLISTGLQWLLQLPAVWLVIHFFDAGLSLIWGVHFSYRAVQTFILWMVWSGESWQTRRV
ncbi:MAG: MATE family efflux transporter [Polyangiaceae bacterium]|nr:MATE family efflux transporter [Polyangiaceae bacterium]